MDRVHYLGTIGQYFHSHPVVAILGPRQCGKTTLARMYREQLGESDIHYYDLERQADLMALQNPEFTLSRLKGLIIIDEIQRTPELFQTLRVLVDEPERKQQYLILGSASRELIRQSSESLAGRIAYLELPPFSYFETHEIDKLWLRGGYPLSYLADNLEDSLTWRDFYIKTFLEQDIPALGIQIPSQTLRRMWSMLSNYHGNIINYSELGRSFGVSDTTIRRYIDILSGTFMVRQLQPWSVNIAKRQVKSPKIYFRDSGLLHHFLNITDESSLLRHAKVGASWEGFSLEQIIRSIGADEYDCYFWATHSGAELDLLIVKGSEKRGFEFKFSDAPKLTKSMQVSMEDLELNELIVIYPGKKDYPLKPNIWVRGLENYINAQTTL